MSSSGRRTADAARNHGPAADVRLPVLPARPLPGRDPVKAGRYPENGASRLTIRTYRISPDGETDGRAQQRTVTSEHDTERLPKSHEWPPCRCPRCRAERETEPR